MGNKQDVLWDAARYGDEAFLQRCLDGAPADTLRLEKVEDFGPCIFTLLGIAAKEGHTGVVTLLVKAGADINYRDSLFAYTALMWSSGKGHTATVHALLAAGADPNLQNRWKETALILASKEGHTATVRTLLAAGADRSVKVHNKNARDWAKTEAIRTLIETYTPPPPPPPYIVLMDAIAAQFAHVPALRDAIQRRDELQSEYFALRTVNANFREIARVGTAHQAAVAAVVQQPLSEEDYLTLAERHATLVQKLLDMCAELVETGDFDAVESLGAKLEESRRLFTAALPQSPSVRAFAPPSIPCGSNEPPQYDALMGECDTVKTHFVHVPTFRDTIQQRNGLQKEYDALKIAGNDFVTLGRVGRALKAASAAVVLTEEDYFTLAARHSALVQKLTTACIKLADAGEFVALDAMAIKLEELQALDVSALPQPWVKDSVQSPAPSSNTDREDDGANDPVNMPPAPGTSQQSTVPSASTAFLVTAGEGEEECANDPVCVSPEMDETTLA